LTVAISYGVRRALERNSIYTRKLVQRGHRIPEALQANVHLDRSASSIMDTNIETVAASETVDEFKRHSGANQEAHWFLVTDGQQVVGIVPKDLESDSGATLGDVASRELCTLQEETPLSEVCARMWRQNAAYALVVPDGQPPGGKVKGLITKSQTADAVAEAMGAFNAE
jgi:CIC family chloride channel protein